MIEGAEKILDYLPIRRSEIEDQYIAHLWEAFAQLQSGNESAEPLSVMPYHLLFVLALQYKVLRIYLQNKQLYQTALLIRNFNNGQEDVFAPGSPFTLALLRETEILDLLRLVGLHKEEAKRIKKETIRYRDDNIAHAKGYVEKDTDAKVSGYLECLETVQKSCQILNDEVAKLWAKEVREGEDMDQFLESRFLDARISPRDFGDILLSILEIENLNFEQWQTIVDKGLEHAPSQAFEALRKVASSPCIDEGVRFNALRVLKENGEILE